VICCNHACPVHQIHGSNLLSCYLTEYASTFLSLARWIKCLAVPCMRICYSNFGQSAPARLIHYIIFGIIKLDTWIGNVGVIGDQMLKQILGGLCVCVSLRGFFLSSYWIDIWEFLGSNLHETDKSCVHIMVQNAVPIAQGKKDTRVYARAPSSWMVEKWWPIRVPSKKRETLWKQFLIMELFN
jgi:hypothetical protein